MPSILLSDNGVSSGSAGLKSTAASDGSLALQTTTAGGTATTAVTIDTSQNVGVGTASPSQRLHVVSSGTTPVNLVGATACQINLNDGTQNANWGLGVGGVGITGIASPSTYPLVLYTNGAERMRLDSSGNLGLGVTPSAWNSDYKSVAVSNYAEFYGRVATPSVGVSYNVYRNSGGSFIYKTSNAAARYEQDSGYHLWYTAGSGTAGATASFTQAMTLDASGRLGVGTTSPAYNLHVVDTIAAVGSIRGSLVARGNFVGSTDIGHLYFNNAANICLANIYVISTDGSASDTGTMVFRTASSGSLVERARFASGGQFCVNTTNTNGAFNVSGNVYLFSQSSGAGNSTLKWNSGTGQVTYDTSSRLVKENIVDSPYGLAEVMQLKSRKYFRTDDQREEIGLVADEVQAVMPEFVPMSAKSIFTGNEADTELVPSGVYYEKLSSVLIKAIQELKAEFDAYKATHP